MRDVVVIGNIGEVEPGGTNLSNMVATAGVGDRLLTVKEIGRFNYLKCFLCDLIVAGMKKIAAYFVLLV